MNKTLIALTIAVVTSQTVFAAGPSPARPDIPMTDSVWNGYKKQSFVVDGAAAYVVVPKIAAPGNPWVWRTSFPDYRPVVDLELVRNGYHIGYVEILNLLGSDTALELMDKFYAQVRSQWKLAEKPALEPCSRGGLPAYRYAEKHPERIACIYGDVPVMDFKSWPLKHPGSKNDNWPLIMKSYGFKTDAEAMAYTGNPIDNLAPLAKAKIPLRHVICLADKVVPPEQNTLEAKRRLEKMGWDLEAVSVATSPECEGHHFAYPDVDGSVTFIMRHTGVLPQGHDYVTLRDGLANCKTKFEKEKTGRVAFLGGSITFNSGWRDGVMEYLQKRFPGTKFDFIAAGIPSVGSNGHAFRLQRDILMRGPVDLLFIEAAVNDGSNIPGKPEIMRRAMEGIVRHIRADNPMTDIVQMHFVMGEHIRDWNAGREPVTIAEHEKAASHYGCVSLDLAHEVADRIAGGQFTWASGFHSDVHPPPYGQRVYINSMIRMLDAAFLKSDAAKPHPLPATCVDPASYANGRFGKLEDVRLGKGFTLVPRWAPARGGTRGGFANVPAIVASEPGAELTCEFEGTAVGFFLAAGYDTCVLEYSVDGAPVRKYDTYSAWSGSLHLPWPVILADGLKPGKHTLTVRTTADAPNRTAVHIIHVLLN